VGVKTGDRQCAGHRGTNSTGEQVRQGSSRKTCITVSTCSIESPPGTEEDILPLVEFFLKKFSDGKKITGLAPQAMQSLMLHDWPGNVRELENMVEYAVAMARQDVITEELVFPAKTGSSEDQIKPLKEARDNFEKNYLIQLLEITRGNVSKAADLAGKYRSDFYNLLKKYVISPLDFKKK
jgi:two-component system response regulator GlrR